MLLNDVGKKREKSSSSRPAEEIYRNVMCRDNPNSTQSTKTLISTETDGMRNGTEFRNKIP